MIDAPKSLADHMRPVEYELQKKVEDLIARGLVLESNKFCVVPKLIVKKNDGL